MKQACKWAQKYGPLIGRLLLANLFIVSGFKKIGGFAGTVGYMAAKMPSLDPNLIKLMLVVTIAVELGGGLMILIGWQARWSRHQPACPRHCTPRTPRCCLRRKFKAHRLRPRARWPATR